MQNKGVKDPLLSILGFKELTYIYIYIFSKSVLFFTIQINLQIALHLNFEILNRT